MRARRLLAVAALAALPFGVGAAAAAPAVSDTARAISKADTGAPIIHIGRNGRGGGGGMHIGGGGGPKFGGGGGGPRFGHGGGGPRMAFRGGPGRGHWHGGGPGHWHGGHGHGHHHHFRPRFYGYGAPYFYNSYYYDDYFDDDDDDDVVVYSQANDGVARCEARYRSFDRRTGTFLSTNGTRKLCPYLR